MAVTFIRLCVGSGAVVVSVCPVCCRIIGYSPSLAALDIVETVHRSAMHNESGGKPFGPQVETRPTPLKLTAA